MKTILISIHPKWCEKIFSGEKTIEVRKTAPKPPFKMVVYCTKGNGFLTRYLGNGKVIGEFVCNEVDKYKYEKTKEGVGKFTISEKDFKDMAIDGFDLFNYADGKDIYGIHITDTILYDKPRELGEFYSIKQCKPAYSPFGYQWNWEDRHKRKTGGWENEYRPVPIECHRCKSLVGGKDYLDEKSGCILFDYECISNYHKPLARPPQSYMRIQV